MSIFIYKNRRDAINAENGEGEEEGHLRGLPVGVVQMLESHLCIISSMQREGYSGYYPFIKANAML